jgi:hypothetical protein
MATEKSLKPLGHSTDQIKNRYATEDKRIQSTFLYSEQTRAKFVRAKKNKL